MAHRLMFEIPTHIDRAILLYCKDTTRSFKPAVIHILEEWLADNGYLVQEKKQGPVKVYRFEINITGADPEIVDRIADELHTRLTDA